MDTPWSWSAEYPPVLDSSQGSSNDPVSCISGWSPQVLREWSHTQSLSIITIKVQPHWHRCFRETSVHARQVQAFTHAHAYANHARQTSNNCVAMTSHLLSNSSMKSCQSFDGQRVVYDISCFVVHPTGVRLVLNLGSTQDSSAVKPPHASSKHNMSNLISTRWWLQKWRVPMEENYAAYEASYASGLHVWPH